MHSANSHETKCIQNQLGKMQFLHIKVYQNFCAFYIFLTLSGPGGGGGGGGLQGLDDQIQKLLTL